VAATNPLTPEAQQAVKDYDDDCKSHDELVRKVERRYRSYRGILERRSEAAQWTSKLHPPYAFQIIETVVASLIDPQPRWRPRARPRLDSPPDLERLRIASKGLQTLLAYQLDKDNFAVQQRPHRLQGLIAGWTARKTYWNYREGSVTRHRTTDVEIAPGLSMPVVRPGAAHEVVVDDPCCEVVDVRDLIFHESAVSVDKSARITHRVFYTFDELKRLEAQGVYQNVDDLKESRDLATGLLESREKTLFDVDRTKGKIEVIEQWRRQPDGSIRVISIGNRKVLLRDKPNPFWHGRYPFLVCSGTPDLFRIPGISDIEVIEQLQEMMWTLQNQRIDNLQLLNNAIVLIADDVDDPDLFEFAPGEKWLVNRPDQVDFLKIDPITSQLSLAAEAQLKADLQAISGGAPWLSGDSQAANANTATEASLLTTLAQRRVAAKKQFYIQDDAAVGEHFLLLDQQFLTEPRYVDIVGMNGEDGYALIDPAHFRDLDLKIDVEALDESLMRQERKAEATAKMQVALQAAPLFAAIPGSPGLNLQAFMDDVLEADDVVNKDRYYSNLPQPGLQQQPGQSGVAQPGQQPPGVSAPQATDMNSPSNAFSQSPVAALQRLGAMAGGPQNT
jgi:hypothetical protein